MKGVTYARFQDLTIIHVPYEISTFYEKKLSSLSLSLFSTFSHFELHCSYKVVLTNRKACSVSYNFHCLVPFSLVFRSRCFFRLFNLFHKTYKHAVDIIKCLDVHSASDIHLPCKRQSNISKMSWKRYLEKASTSAMQKFCEKQKGNFVLFQKYNTTRGATIFMYCCNEERDYS